MPTPAKKGIPFRLNTTTADDQNQSQIAVLKDGTFVATWTSSGQDNLGRGIYAQHFTANGQKIGGEIQVSSTASFEQDQPSIVALSGGGFAVSYTSFGTFDINQDGHKNGVFGQVFDSSANKVGSELQLNVTFSDDQQAPDMIATSDGGFIVALESSVGANFHIDGYRFDANGAVVAPGVFQIDTSIAGNSSNVQITALKNGNLVAIWDNDSDDTVHGQILSATGVKIGTSFSINTDITNYQRKGDIVGLKGGGFVATWYAFEEEAAGNFSYGIFAQRFSADGSKVGSEFLVNSEIAGSQSSPKTTDLPDGGFVITWTSDEQDGDSYDVFAQRYDSRGGKVGSEFVVNTYSINSQTISSIETLKDGSFVISWTSVDQDGGGSGEYAQIFKAELYGSRFGEKLIDKVGANWLSGRNGDDVLKGLNGSDKIFGDKGNDKLFGGKGNDKLSGGKGNDKLTGGAGKDKFVFAKKEGKDTITDFENGKDKIDLSAFNFNNKSQALAKFYELGSGSNDKLAFDFKDTTIIVKGIDMGDLNNADIII